MKKRKSIKLGCVAIFLLPLLSAGVKTDGIKKISKPYTGTYTAEQVLWGKDDVLPMLKDLKMELLPKGQLRLTYKQFFKTQTQYLSYKIDEDGELWISDKEQNGNWHKATCEKGEIIVTAPLGNKTLYARFSRP